MQKDVFISYSSSEYAEAGHTKRILEENGFSCWMAPESIPAGSDYGAEIEDAITGCSVFVLLLSAKSQKSVWVPKELGMAISNGKTVLPFHIDASDIVKPFTFHLTNVQRIEAYNNISEAYMELVRQVGAVTSKNTGKFRESADTKAAENVCNTAQKDNEAGSCSVVQTEQYDRAITQKKPSLFGFGKGKKMPEKTKFIKGLTLETDGLRNRMPDGDGGSALRRLYETVRYSDPVSTEAVEQIEAQITEKAALLKSFVADGDHASVTGIVNDIELLLGDRNRLLRVVK